MIDGSVLVLPSNPLQFRNSSVNFSFRQNSDILYLTGSNTPNLYLMVCKDADIENSIQIFSPRVDPKMIRWEGKQETASMICERIGISSSAAYDLDDFDDQIKETLQNKIAVYVPLGLDSELDTKLIQFCNEANRNTRKGSFAPRSFIHYSELSFQTRIIKDTEEIKLMQKAANISAKAHNDLMRFSRSLDFPFKEYQLRAFLESNFFNQGATDLAYPSIVASGSNGTILHYTQNNATVKANDLILVDAGCEYNGYASDITRTFPASGKFSEIQKIVYSIVLEAQKSAIDLAQAGKSIEDVHQAAIHFLIEGVTKENLINKYPDPENEGEWIEKPSKEEILEKELFRCFYMHRTSHFIGLDVHDVGSYYKNQQPRILEPGMVITIEPGLYFDLDADYIDDRLKGLAVRIEDDIFIESSGNLVLSKNALKEINEIESLEALS